MKKYLYLLLYCFFLISGVLIFHFTKTHLSHFLLSAFVILFSLLKIGCFLVLGFKNLVFQTHQAVAYHRFLGMVAMHILCMVFSFAVDYYLIFKSNIQAFSGLEMAENNFKIFFKMFYLSFMLFTNMGVANVVPVSIAAECITMFEAIVSFSTIIFILSDFVSIKDTLIKIKEGAKNKI